MVTEDEKEAGVGVRASGKTSVSSFVRLIECVDSNSIVGLSNVGEWR